MLQGASCRNDHLNIKEAKLPLCNGAITKNNRGTKQTFTLIINQPHAVHTAPSLPPLLLSLSLSLALSPNPSLYRPRLHRAKCGGSSKVTQSRGNSPRHGRYSWKQRPKYRLRKLTSRPSLSAATRLCSTLCLKQTYNHHFTITSSWKDVLTKIREAYF